MPRRFVILIVATALSVAAACSRDPQVAKRRYFDSGTKYAKELKYKEAIVEFRNAVKVDPKFGEARYQLGEAYARTGALSDAYREYVRAADLMPANVDAQVKAGSVLLLAGKFEDAKARADKALALNASSVDGQILRANALAHLKDIDAAVKEIESAIQLDPQRANSYESLGALQLVKGDKQAAEAAFNHAVELAPRSVPARLAQANYYWSIDRRDSAETSLKAALQIDTNDVSANRALATFYVASNRAADAEPFLKRIVAITKAPAARFTLAEYYVGTNRAAEGKALLKELSDDPALGTDAQLRLASVEFGEGHGKDAHAIVDGVLKNNPNNAPALVLKGRFFLSEQNADAALERFTAAIAADARSADAQYFAGKAYELRQDRESAVKAFTEVLKLNPHAVVAQLELANLHMAAGRVDASLEFAENAAKDAPGNPAARLMVARGLMARGDQAGAERTLTAMAKAMPNSAPVEVELGKLRLVQKKPSDARAAFTRGLGLDPGNVDALAGLVAIDMAEHHVDAARARVEDSLHTQPNSASLLVLAGRVYAASGDAAHAEDALRKAIAADASRIDAYGLLGSLFMSQRRLDDARAEFERVAEKQPRSVPAHTMVATILHMQNKTADAQKRYEKILEIDPRAAVAANNLAWIYGEQGANLDVALQLAQTAKSVAPESPEINDTLGWIYLKKDLATLAIDPLRKSVEKDPKNPSYQYHLGLAYKETGDRRKATEALELAAKANPQSPDAASASKLLAEMHE